MKILTKYLGEVEANEEQFIHFQSGIPGFNEETKFILLELPGNPVFQILQSITTSGLAFVVTNPYHFYHDYAFEMDINVKESLAINSKNDVTIYSIVTLRDPFEKSTLNLKAPVIINPATKQGKQFILNQEAYSTISTLTLTKSPEARGV